MQKSKSELRRLEINAKAQHVLTRSFIKQIPKDEKTGLSNPQNDVYQPSGEIDYSRFNKSIKS